MESIVGVVDAADFFGAGVFLVAQDKGLRGGGLVGVCKDEGPGGGSLVGVCEDEGRGGSAVAATEGAKWASLDPFGVQGFQVGRLLPTHLDRSSISLFGVAIWSRAPFICTQVGIVSPLVLGGAVVVSKAWVTTCRYALLRETLLILASTLSPKMANGSGWAW